jgi:hypothetical protein
MHAKKVTKKYLDFYEGEREKLDSLEALGYGVFRWNVEGLRLKRLGACRKYKLVQLRLQA